MQEFLTVNGRAVGFGRGVGYPQGIVKLWALFVLTVAVGCSKPPGPAPQMTATCKPSLDEGYVCNVANLSDINVRACWLLRIQCSHGTIDEGNACEDLGPHGSAIHKMTIADLNRHSNCEELTSVAVPQMLAVPR